MAVKSGRRRFLQTSLAAGTALALTGGNASQGDACLGPPRAAVEANPAALPGRVRWHENFAAARTASGGSGKPVLLFHMMGRLDQKFC